MEKKENTFEFTVTSLEEAEKVVKEVQKEVKNNNNIVIKIHINPKKEK